MTSMTDDASRGAYAAGAGTTDVAVNGWMLFSGVMLLFAGIWIGFEGIFAFFRSTWFAGSAVFGSLWIWAIAWVAFGVLLIAAGSAILGGRTWARWFGIVVAALAALLHMLSFATYPWWSAAMIAIYVLILFGLTARWQRPEGAPM